MKKAIDIKVVINPMNGSIAAPDAQFDVLLYYSRAEEDNFNSAPGVDDELANEAAYFARKCITADMKGAIFYDYTTGEFLDEMPSRRTNFSTLIFGGQFVSEKELLSFLDSLRSATLDPDVRGGVKLILAGSGICKQLAERVGTAFRLMDEALAKKSAV